MDDQPKPKLNWWVDAILFLSAPVLAFLVGLTPMFGEFGTLVLLAPFPCGLALGYRMARRVAHKETVIALLTFFFGAFFAAAIAATSMFGCSLADAI